MYTPEFHTYDTVILLSDLDFVALNNEHIFIIIPGICHLTIYSACSNYPNQNVKENPDDGTCLPPRGI